MITVISQGMVKLLGPIMEAARQLSSKGWCREYSGNISMIVEDPIEIWDLEPFLFNTGEFLPQLEGKIFLFTRSGSKLKDLPEDPEKNLGLYLAARGGSSLSLLWGEGAPTSEWMSHLLTYALAGGKVKAIVHAHMDEVELLKEHFMDLAPDLPDWVGWVPDLPPGSMDLAQATVQEIGRYDIMLWEGHGILAPGKDLEDCMSRLERFSEWVSMQVQTD